VEDDAHSLNARAAFVGDIVDEERPERRQKGVQPGETDERAAGERPVTGQEGGNGQGPRHGQRRRNDHRRPPTKPRDEPSRKPIAERPAQEGHAEGESPLPSNRETDGEGARPARREEHGQERHHDRLGGDGAELASGERTFVNLVSVQSIPFSRGR